MYKYIINLYIHIVATFLATRGNSACLQPPSPQAMRKSWALLEEAWPFTAFLSSHFRLHSDVISCLHRHSRCWIFSSQGCTFTLHSNFQTKLCDLASLVTLVKFSLNTPEYNWMQLSTALEAYSHCDTLLCSFREQTLYNFWWKTKHKHETFTWIK